MCAQCPEEQQDESLDCPPGTVGCLNYAPINLVLVMHGHINFCINRDMG